MGYQEDMEGLGLLPWTQEFAESLMPEGHGRSRREACSGAPPKVPGSSLEWFWDRETFARQVLGRIALSFPAWVRLKVMPASCIL